MVLFLVGYMGCGKSSMGRQLARKLGFGFADMDSQIEQQCGKTVAEIFEQHGQEHFRAMERQWIEGLASEDDMVVATGGGAPCFGDNMQIMNNKGITVYFKMSPAKLVTRLAHGRDKRPLIRGMKDEQLLEFITENLEKREPYYEKARLIIDCDGMSDDYILSHVENYLKLVDKI